MTTTPRPDAGPKHPVEAWLDEQEGYGFRMERLVEDLENGADIIPWLKSAYALALATPDPTSQAAIDDRLRPVSDMHVHEPPAALSVGEGARAMTISLNEREMAALKKVMASKELSGPAVFRNSFRLYQLVDLGLATVTHHNSGPNGTDTISGRDALSVAALPQGEDGPADQHEGWTGARCPSCKGTGELNNDPLGPCPKCGGTGDEWGVVPTPPTPRAMTEGET